ncbi:MAG: adenylyltransferase/cytidyltransferase family protein [Verrucomicrobiota bacterium]|nr:adenylyltransferase/cytidyltransferase family protein [Verrucomicrobiota bacterium]
MTEKVISVDELARVSEKMRTNCRKLVVTNGCFDLLHIGHVRYLQSARRLGDALAVAVNGDVSVRALKGEGRPLNREKDRAEILAALECVDHVAIFPELRATGLLEQVRPAIYVKGGDYTAETLDPEERAVLVRAGAEIKILPLETGFSTSRLIEQMRCG